jgi:dihydrofolate reductase
MGKLVLFMHCSLDGFAAGVNGEMDWIHVDNEMFDFVGDRVDQTDTALYGRVTFEMMEGYWPTAGDQPNASKHDIDHSRWYMKANKVVLSRTLQGKSLPKTQIISNNIKEEVSKIKSQTDKDILIFGSPSATHALLAEGLVDDYWLFVNPVLLGKGIPVFKDIRQLTKLKLVSTKVFSAGVVCLAYETKKD